VFVHSVATAEGEFNDVISSYYGDVNDQVAHVCAQLRNITELSGGYNAVGFSQGGQFLRAVAQRCQHTGGPRMRTLVTLGGQHQGVSNVPGCRTLAVNASHGLCHLMQKMLGAGAYLPYVRDHIVQAQYFKDPLRLDEYLTANPFLPDINNERGPAARNPLYAANLATLERLVLLRFADDETVVPRDSAWFSFFDGERVVPLREQPLYREDWLGLRALDEAGRLEFAEAPGGHMQFTLQWFSDNVMDKYLAPS
ncbi:Palmitoyl-protein thioesterase 1, partial [Tetrabaena socialis]